jgi:hypothetical protein
MKHAQVGLAVLFVLFATLIAVLLYAYNTPTQICGSRAFHDTHDGAVRSYLKRVYPVASSAIDRMDTMDAARFFNGLSVLYNCSYAYTGPLARGGWGALPCAGNKNNLLPYVPDGFFYFWPSYAEKNKHTVEFSCGRGDGVAYPVHMLGSQRPDAPWGSGTDGGEISRDERSGPGPFWVFPYSMVRNIYHPAGPYFDDARGRWGYRSIDADNFAFTRNNWMAGAPRGAYIEVAHASWEPGMAQSQGLWMTPFYAGGTGLFYRVGETLVANNKVDALIKLVGILQSKTRAELDMPDTTSRGGTDFGKMSGSQILEHWFGTSDPYMIAWKYCAKASWGGMAKTSSGGFLVVPEKWVGIDNKGVLSASGLFTPGKLGEQGPPYAANAVVTFDQVAQWYAAKNNKKFTSEYDLHVYALTGCAAARDYILDRAGTIVSFDEPIFWLANILGYETIQLVVSANANGLWSPELIHTVVPDAEWARLVRGRIYDFIEGDDAKSSFEIDKGAPRYTMGALFKWHEMTSRLVSQRNPFNLSDGRTCNELGAMKGDVISYSDKHFLAGAHCSATDNSGRCWRQDSNDYGYTHPQCATKGQWGVTAQNAQVFPGKTFWGHYNKELGCLPVYENIYCNGGLAADYSMVNLYSGKDLGRST